MTLHETLEEAKKWSEANNLHLEWVETDGGFASTPLGDGYFLRVANCGYPTYWWQAWLEDENETLSIVTDGMNSVGEALNEVLQEAQRIRRVLQKLGL